MKYWLNLFSMQTWNEFCTAGSVVTGFRGHKRNKTMASRVSEGDIFLCYLVGASRWIGLLQAKSKYYLGQEKIWNDDEKYPVRFSVEPIIKLNPEHSVPMDELRGKLSFFQQHDTAQNWSSGVRGSLKEYKRTDAETIIQALKDAQNNPVSRPIDPKKLQRPSNLYRMKQNVGGTATTKVVVIPNENEEEADALNSSLATHTHTEMQLKLIELGENMGFSVWAPKSDRNCEWDNRKISQFQLLETLPTQFDKVTNAVIQNIDVIWFRGNSIEAAFEVEHTSSIYSGLLRMSDLLVMQPNIDIKLYLVAPDERFDKFTREIPRPTFSASNKPLHELCKFLPYSKLCENLEKAKGFVKHLKPEFIDEISESFNPEEFVL